MLRPDAFIPQRRSNQELFSERRLKLDQTESNIVELLLLFVFGLTVECASMFCSWINSSDEPKSNDWLTSELSSNGKYDDWETVRNGICLLECSSAVLGVNGNDRWWANLVVFNHFCSSASSTGDWWPDEDDGWPVRAAMWLSISSFACSTFSGRPAISKTGSLSRPGVMM